MGKLHDAVKAAKKKGDIGDAFGRDATPEEEEIAREAAAALGIPGYGDAENRAEVFAEPSQQTHEVECWKCGGDGYTMREVQVGTERETCSACDGKKTITVLKAPAPGYRITPKADAPAKPDARPTEPGSGQGAAKGAKGGPKKRKAPPRLPDGSEFRCVYDGVFGHWRIWLDVIKLDPPVPPQFETTHRTLFGGLAKLDAIFRKWEKAAKKTVEQPTKAE